MKKTKKIILGEILDSLIIQYSGIVPCSEIPWNKTHMRYTSYDTKILLQHITDRSGEFMRTKQLKVYLDDASLKGNINYVIFKYAIRKEKLKMLLEVL